MLVVALALGLGHTPTPTDERPLADAIAVEGDAQCLERERLAAPVEGWLGYARLDARLDVVAREQDDRVEFVLRRDESVRVESEGNLKPAVLSADAVAEVAQDVETVQYEP